MTLNREFQKYNFNCYNKITQFKNIINQHSQYYFIFYPINLRIKKEINTY